MRRLALTIALLGGCLFGGVQQASAQEADVNFIRNATSTFDNYTANATPAQRNWIQNHYGQMRGYPPFFDQALDWAPPTQSYRDLYAIYRDAADEKQLIKDHPNWVLRNSAGTKLYIPCDCNGSSCTQYAANVGSPGWRAHWIDMARDDVQEGYSGIFIDDVNMDMNVSNGAGKTTRPMDPQTGHRMTKKNWQRYIAEFVEQIREELPDATITHNSQWWHSHKNKSVRRQVRAADQIEMERGFSDPGLVPGGGMYGFKTYLRQVDWVHNQGASVVLEPYDMNRHRRIFEVAGFLLTTNGKDHISAGEHADPNNWWRGWETTMGQSVGKRYNWHGVIRRDFTNGTVLLNQPYSRKRKVPVDRRYFKLSGGRTKKHITLGASRGAVLFNHAYQRP